MKYDIEKLKRIDWAKFSIGILCARAELVREPNHIAIWCVGICRAVRVLDSHEWRIHGGDISIVTTVCAASRKLDAFIVSEIAAMELADKRERTKPPPGDGFEYCEKDEATDYSFRLENGNTSGLWWPIEACAQLSTGTYYFRRPIAKPLVLSGGEFVKWLIDNPGEHWFSSPGLNPHKWRWGELGAVECASADGRWHHSYIGTHNRTLQTAKPTCERCGK